MTEAKYHAIQVKALRTARQYHRALQTQAERLERILDRMIESKKVIRDSTYAKMVAQWDVIKQAYLADEKALADAFSSGTF